MSDLVMFDDFDRLVCSIKQHKAYYMVIVITLSVTNPFLFVIFIL